MFKKLSAVFIVIFLHFLKKSHAYIHTSMSDEDVIDYNDATLSDYASSEVILNRVKRQRSAYNNICRQPTTDANTEIQNAEAVSSWRTDGGYRPGTELKFQCKDGYTMRGNDTIFCIVELTNRRVVTKWNDPPPKCEVPSNVSCLNPGPIANGRVVIRLSNQGKRRAPSIREEDYRRYSPETELKYICDQGYFLKGDSNTKCQGSGHWSEIVHPSCLQDCGRSAFRHKKKIAHGIKAHPGEWPWVVAIAEIDSKGYFSLICGGVLLDERTVLSAGHCFENKKLSTSVFRLYFGKLYSNDRRDDEEVEVRKVTGFLIHPQYNRNEDSYLEHDIALIKFTPSVVYTDRIQPVCLPTLRSTSINLEPQTEGHIAGWGITDQQKTADLLMTARLPVQSNSLCEDVFQQEGNPISITAGMFCAGFRTNATTTCSGDSGSPMVFLDRQTDRYIVEGIVSYGINDYCGLPNRFTVFTRVEEYLHWIESNLR